MKSRVLLVSVGRSDYGYFSPLYRRLNEESDIEVGYLVGGMHLEERFGLTVRMIEKDGARILGRVPLSMATGAPADIARSMGEGVTKFAEAYQELKPDLVVVLGDRYETMAAALATVPFNLPLLHLYGGERTDGAMDDVFRHAITKMSHLHGVSAESCRRRLVLMGEDPERIVQCGLLSLEGALAEPFLDQDLLSEKTGVPFGDEVFYVTYHPVTRELDRTEQEAKALLQALERFDQSILFTLPNADTLGDRVAARIREFVRNHPQARLVENLGAQLHWSVMHHATVMIGNSSSGILEAPSVGLPVVNVGNRQKGRERALNVIDSPGESGAIENAIRQAISTDFRKSIEGMTSPFEAADPSGSIVELIHRFFKTPEWRNKIMIEEIL